MAKQRVEGIAYVDGFLDRCREFGQQWVRFHQLLIAYPSAESKAPLEQEFLHLKSTLARGYSVLRPRLGSDCAFSTDLPNVLAGATSLESIHSQSEVSVRKLEQEWHRVFMSINETLGNLQEKRRRALAGERVFVADALIRVQQPYAWKRALGGAAVLLIVAGLAAGAWFSRNFLGYGAPVAGEGIEYAADMSEEQKIAMMMGRMTSAFGERDIDTLMTAFSDGYSDEEGNNKTTIRVLLQTLNSTVGFRDARLEADRCFIQVEGEIGLVSNVQVIAEGKVHEVLVHGRKEQDKWLITQLEVD